MPKPKKSTKFPSYYEVFEYYLNKKKKDETRWRWRKVCTRNEEVISVSSKDYASYSTCLRGVLRECETGLEMHPHLTFTNLSVKVLKTIMLAEKAIRKIELKVVKKVSKKSAVKVVKKARKKVASRGKK